ncbi:hypothetical protein ASF51_12135 [Agreia sp. Leaf283]|nr:hypothetical protein ASF51_12135 [Agreia sp. Leaf283]
MAEARRMGIQILPLDVNASTDEYLVELTDDGVKAIRYSLTDVRGITQPEKDRILTGQPYENILDFWMRATPSRRLLVDLATVGALDTLADSRSGRSDIIAYVRQLSSRRKPKAAEHENQLELYIWRRHPGRPRGTVNRRTHRGGTQHPVDRDQSTPHRKLPATPRLARRHSRS